MLSALYDKVKSLFGIETDSRKRRITDTDCMEIPNAKIRRIEKPLAANNCSSSICRNLSTMSKFDGNRLVLRRECPDEFTWEKRNTGKENQFTMNSSSPDSDVIVIEDDFEEVSHLKPCKHGFRNCEGAHSKDHIRETQQVRKQTHSLHNEEVHLVEDNDDDDDDDDVMFLRDSSKDKKRITKFTYWSKPIQFSVHRKDCKQPLSDGSQRIESGEKSHGLTKGGSWFDLDQPFQNHQSRTPERMKTTSVNKFDSPSVRGRVRSGNLSRAAILKKSLAPPPKYFGVEPKLCPRWAGLDDKIRKKPTALTLCSAIDEMKAYNHILQQFTSESSSKPMNTRYDSQAFKLFESQLRRNYSYSQLLKKKVGVESSQVIETIDLSTGDEDNQEVAFLDEACGSIVKKKPDSDVVEILPRKDIDVVSIVPRRVDVQRTRELIPKSSGDKMEADKKHLWAPPNAVEEMIKKSHVTNEEFINNIVERYTDEKAKIGKEVEVEQLKKKIWSERRKTFESSLEDRLKKYMTITEVILEDKEAKEEEEELPELTQEMMDAVHDALQKGRSCVLARFGPNTITGADIQTLADSNWLNDEVINNYMDMLTQRGQSNEYPSVYCFNTFFYHRLNCSGYSSIRRWTKKVDIFQKDMLIIPLHLEIHWALAVVDFRQKSVCYYDSMNGRKKNILQIIMKYLQEEKADKKKENFDSSGWEMNLIQGIPQQRNGYDCGVFACMFAEHLSRGVVSGSKRSSKCGRTYPPFPFSQDNMPYFRKRMIYEILSGKLLQ